MKNIVFSLLVLCICGIGGVRFYLPKLIDEKISDRINSMAATIQKRHDQLAETVKNLESRQQDFENLSSKHKTVSNFKANLERWNCWCDLKNKLRHGNKCLEELAKFRGMFSDCPELLKRVDSLISDQNSETKDDSLIKNLLKFVRMHNISEDKLGRVDGYVLLLSIGKE